LCKKKNSLKFPFFTALLYANNCFRAKDVMWAKRVMWIRLAWTILTKWIIIDIKSGMYTLFVTNRWNSRSQR
jgi:hypothetical protein